MDPENFLEIANQVTKLQMVPYFELAHCLIMCMYVREDLAAGKHPFNFKCARNNSVFIQFLWNR